jgi:hypothetical protein
VNECIILSSLSGLALSIIGNPALKRWAIIRHPCETAAHFTSRRIAEHSAVEREMLAAYIDKQNFESVKESVTRVFDALWETLSGV